VRGRRKKRERKGRARGLLRVECSEVLVVRSGFKQEVGGSKTRVGS